MVGEILQPSNPIAIAQPETEEQVLPSVRYTLQVELDINEPATHYLSFNSSFVPVTCNRATPAVQGIHIAWMKK